MTYSTKTWSNTPPGRYHVHQTLSHWQNRQKTNRRQKTEAKPCHALSSSQTTPAHGVGVINPGPTPKLGGWLCCWLQLSWLPVSRSSEGDTQSCWIVIGIALNNRIEGTAPNSWSVVDSHTQRLGPNHWFCCQCWNWRRDSMVMLTSARQMKLTIIISLLDARAHSRLSGGASRLETLLRGDVNFHSTNQVEVLIIVSFWTQVPETCCTVLDGRVVDYVRACAKVQLCRYWNWRHISMAMLTSVQQRKWKCWSWVPFLNASAHGQLFSGGCSFRRVCVGDGVGVSVKVGDASP